MSAQLATKRLPGMSAMQDQNKIPTFVIDSKGSKPESSGPRTRYEVKLSSSLDPGIELSGYLPVKPVDAFQMMSKMSSATSAANFQLKPDKIESFEPIGPQKISKRLKKKMNNLERSKSSGDGWYNMPSTEITPEIKNDLQVLKMRSALDPKRFYKKKTTDSIPKFFQVGTVVGTSADYYTSLTRKQKKQSLVDELMADTEARKYHKAKAVLILKSNPFYQRIARKKLSTKLERKSDIASDLRQALEEQGVRVKKVNKSIATKSKKSTDDANGFNDYKKSLKQSKKKKPSKKFRK